MKKFILGLALLTSMVSFGNTVKVLECDNLPEDYFAGIQSIEVSDNYDSRYRIHSATYKDGKQKIHGSSYMGEKSDIHEVFNLENKPAKHNTYDFNIKGTTLRLRADGAEAGAIKGNWYIDPLGDYGVNVVYLNCN